MTREEAIKELRGFIGHLTEGCQEAIKVLIPQLVESEDERVIKWIASYIHKGVFDEEEHPKALRAIEWLEKQKEVGNHNTLPIEQQMEAAMIAIRGGMPSKSQEWSEEDEDIRQSIIKDIKWERANTPVTVDKDIRKYDKQIAWLKSLRPQPHTVSIKDATKFGNLEYERGVKDGLNHRWKPSEEQMKALQNAVALTACDKELTRLYNQLKKL